MLYDENVTHHSCCWMVMLTGLGFFTEAINLHVNRNSAKLEYPRNNTWLMSG
jgi:hypothetical protein